MSELLPNGVIDMYKTEVIRMTKEIIKCDKLFLGKLLTFVSSEWENIVKAKDKDNYSKHLRALTDLLISTGFNRSSRKNARLFSNAECCMMLEAMSEVFYDAKGRSVYEISLLNHFRNSALALGWKPDDNFIKNIRGKEKFLTALYADLEVENEQ